MAQKLLVVSDMHDDLESFQRAVDYGAAQEVDRVAHLGDVSLRPYTAGHLQDLLNSRNVEQFLARKRRHTRDGVLADVRRIVQSAGLPITLIGGNYDDNKDLESVFGFDFIGGGSLAKFGEASVMGYSGADANPPHIQLLQQVGENRDFDHQLLYNRLSEAQPDIAIIHNPPQGLCDDMFNGRNVGTGATLQYLQRTSRLPKLILSGHIHEAGPNGNNPNGVQGVAEYRDEETGQRTVVLNPGNIGRFGLLDPRSLEMRMQFPFGTFVVVDLEDDGSPLRVHQYSVEGPNRTVSDVRHLRSYTL